MLNPPRSQPAARPQPPDVAARAAGFRRVAGVDEAGRGPWAGPVVAAAVVLHRPRLSVRIDDSKRLTRLQRARAYDAILQHADVGVGVVCADEIDRRNILQATLLAMRAAVCDLAAAPDLVIVDGHIAPPLEPPCWPVVNGDQLSYRVACASIIAKELRDRLMEFYHHLAPAYAFHLHKGYGTAQHAALLRRHGPSIFHRRSFQPVLEAMRDGSPV
jgi:ribonuclease HII